MTHSSKFRPQLQLWWPAVLVFVMGSVLSAMLWWALEEHNARTVQERLEQRARLFTTSLEQRLHAYAEHLKIIRPLLERSQAAGSEVFDYLNFFVPGSDARYPGLQEVSIVRRVASDGSGVVVRPWPQVLRPSPGMVAPPLQPAEPVAAGGILIEEIWPSNAQRTLAGRDEQREGPLVTLLQRLQQLDEPVLTPPFQLHGDDASVSGFLMSVPLRSTDAAARKPQELPAALNISFSTERLIRHLRERNMLQDLCVAIYDTTGVADAAGQKVLLGSNWAPGQDTARTQHTIDLLGRQWTLEFAPRQRVLSSVERFFPVLVAGSTMGATVLLATLVFLLSIKGVRAEVRAKARHHRLRERSDRFLALFHQSAVGVAEVDLASDTYVSMNQRFADILGRSMEELMAMRMRDCIHPLDRAECLQQGQKLLHGQQAHYCNQLRVDRKDGQECWCEIWVSALTGADGKSLGRHIVLLIDVTERHRMQERLRAREAYSGEMLRYMPVGFVVVGSIGNIEFVNHQFEVCTGWKQQELPDASTMWSQLCMDTLDRGALQQHLQLDRHADRHGCELIPAKEYLLRRKDGQELPMEVSGRFMDGRLLLSFVDISQRKAAEAKIRWLGYYDTLTHLPNRRMLLERLSEALHRCTGGRKGALLLLDIDNFKSLNETLGHEHGDELLCLVAKRLSGCIAGRHTLARQDGDEFAVVLEDLPTDPLEAGRSTEQTGGTILQALRTPFFLDKQDFHVTVSMGAVLFGGKDDDTVENVLKRADLALFQAKSAGRDSLQFFDPSMQQAVSARVEMEKDIRLALERHEFDLFYQPQVQHDRVIGAEALLRWRHPVKGFISPGIFVPAAEESGLILALGEWVLYAACRQLARWAADPVLSRLTMSVNVSPRQFYQANFVEQVKHALQVTGARASQLELELTEGMLLADVEDTIRKMMQLKAMGVIFSLDDFGTGYSSLSYLKRLPLDKLKIDQSFVCEVETSANDATIARSIIALGNSLGLQVIAEGVETEPQRQFLAENGCSYWQGYLFSRPLVVQEFEAWVHAYHAERQEARYPLLS